MREIIKEIEKIPIRKILFFKAWYVFGLFTLIYLGALAFDLIVGLEPDSVNSAIAVISMAIGLSAIDVALMWKEKFSPAMFIMVLSVSPFYVLYKLFKNKDLLKLDLIDLPKRIKRYTVP